MDRKLEIAEMRVADLEFQLLDAEERVQQWKDLLQKEEAKNEDLRVRVQTAANILEEAGLRNSDGSLVFDQAKINLIRERIERGRHMEMFVELNKTNPLLNDAWNKYMLALRLVGFDGTNTPETN